MSIVGWQFLSWIHGFQVQFIYGIASCSVLFVFIEFLRGPQASVPFVQVAGAEPSAHDTVQLWTSLQETRHGPRHSTAQVVTLVQAMVLPGPARTPQRSTLRQSYWQLAPQKAPHETVL